MAKIIAVCRSQRKGTTKSAIAEGYLKEDHGLVDDAHADPGSHRQLSLLAIESVNKMQGRGLELGPGDFAENLTTEGIDLVSLPVGTRLRVGEGVLLELTQHGKECHRGCAILQQIGSCIMPREGVFARILRGGPVRAGDTIRLAEEPRG
ncbi:MAG: MOSC domain-containing protein [Chloroflexota bacterium]